MTTYNAKDLIEQATMLADLQNSDFISWKENMMFLDNAWSDLYQQIINHGDKSFLKTFTFTGDRIELPRDFYQLHYVCYTDGVDRRPINRKAKTANDNGPYYDLVEDELVIYNKLNSIRNIEVQYFAVRDSITFAADDKNVDSIDGTVIDVCEKKVLYEDNGEYFVLDYDTGNVSTVSQGFMLSKTGVISDNTKPYFKWNNRAFYTIHDTNTLTIYKANGTVFKKISDVDVVPNFPTATINGLSENGIYWIDNGVLKYWDFEAKLTEDVIDDIIDTRIYCFGEDIYFVRPDGIWCDEDVLIDATDFDDFNGVMKQDMKTGYGILVDNSVLKSVYGNTKLLFPNNVYYNFLAYKLAVYYKIKQNADYSGLVVIANDALKTFYDTLPKDENEYVRIANVYAK